MRRLFLALGLICMIIFSMVTTVFSDECRGDIDGNGVVDGSDLADFVSDYGSTDCPVKTIKYIICEGDLTPGGRWCDNADGTITDMTTGLFWLKDASWGGKKAWRCEEWSTCPNLLDDAHARAGILKDGMTGAGLSDGSVEGDWRLPTKSELVGIVQGDEAVSSGTPNWFIGVHSSYYWSSTTYAIDTDHAWLVYMYFGYVDNTYKDYEFYVWPVRGGN